MTLLKTEPCYIVLYVLALLTALILYIEWAHPRRSGGRPGGGGASRADPAPSAQLRQAQAAVESLTPDERRRLRRWVDERWPPEAVGSGGAVAPGPKTPDERVTTAPALRPGPFSG